MTPSMDFLVIPLLSAAVATLTLVSGFGLGTLLLPAFAIFFPMEIAIAATGVVHFVNNIFKAILIARWADRGVVLRFGLPAAAAALLGAGLMTAMVEVPALHSYRLGPLPAEITWLKLVIAGLLALFAALELWPRYQQVGFPRGALPIGGVLSGFFGGVSGMQGALRAPFLLRAGLDERGYVGTANVITLIVDSTRLAVYAVGLTWLARHGGYATLSDWRTLALVAAACAAAFLGSYAGTRLIRKVTVRGVRNLVAVLLFVAAAALAAGVV